MQSECFELCRFINLFSSKDETSRDSVFIRLNILSVNVIGLESERMRYLFYPKHSKSSERTWIIADKL